MAVSFLGEAGAFVGEAEALGLGHNRSPETPKGPDVGPLAAELMGVLWSAAADPVVCSVIGNAIS